MTFRQSTHNSAQQEGSSESLTDAATKKVLRQTPGRYAFVYVCARKVLPPRNTANRTFKTVFAPKVSVILQIFRGMEKCANHDSAGTAESLLGACALLCDPRSAPYPKRTTFLHLVAAALRPFFTAASQRTSKVVTLHGVSQPNFQYEAGGFRLKQDANIGAAQPGGD